MARTEHETVAIEPVGVLGVVLHGVTPEHVAYFGHAQRQSRVPCLGGVHCVHGEHSHVVHTALVNLGLQPLGVAPVPFFPSHLQQILSEFNYVCIPELAV